MKNNILHTGITGYPLTHTLSPKLHNAMYQELGIIAVMHAYPEAAITAVVECIKSMPLSLTAITIPHKERIIPYLDVIDDVARAIGAVNTVINKGGRLIGYNTDATGIGVALQNVPLGGKKVLLVGAGGAARAVAYYLAKQESDICYYNRTIANAEILQAQYDGMILKNSQVRTNNFDLVINTTPIGFSPNTTQSPLPDFRFRKEQVIFDVIYNPLKTRLLQDAEQVGAKIISGMVMFVAQAIEQVRLWTGKSIPLDRAKELLNSPKL